MPIKYKFVNGEFQVGFLSFQISSMKSLVKEYFLLNFWLLVPLRQACITSRERLFCSYIDLTVFFQAVCLKIHTKYPLSGSNTISCSYASYSHANQFLFTLYKLQLFPSFSHHLDHLGLAYIMEICTSIITSKQFSSTSFSTSE